MCCRQPRLVTPSGKPPFSFRVSNKVCVRVAVSATAASICACVKETLEAGAPSSSKEIPIESVNTVVSPAASTRLSASTSASVRSYHLAASTVLVQQEERRVDADVRTSTSDQVILVEQDCHV